MSQITNLNVAPYYDDFDPTDNYHRVLFKPGYPVQARELTTLQSILQNQIERFGQHFFKEGGKVIPGNTAYSRNYFAVELNTTHQGVPIDAYIDQLIGLKITGRTSGVTAIVSSILTSSDSERGNPTLYLNYLGSSTQNNATQVFADGEILKIEGEMKRYTNYVCPQAVPVLQTAVGVSLREEGWDRRVMKEIGRQGCEHFAEIIIECGHCLDQARMSKALWEALENDPGVDQQVFIQNWLDQHPEHQLA